MTVTRISETKKGRFALFDEEDEFLFSVDGETLHKHGIREGCALDGAALAALRFDSDTRRAKDKALRLLAVRDHASRRGTLERAWRYRQRIPRDLAGVR